MIDHLKFFSEQKYISTEVKKILGNNSLIPLFLYTGIYNYQSVNTHLITLRQYLESHIDKKQTIRRIYNILVECIENINRHGFSFKRENDFNSIYGYVIFATEESRYSVWVGNFISKEDVNAIKKLFDEIVISDNTDLKEAYSFKLQNNELSEKQGMGIGIIDIAIQSKEPINYKITPFTDTVSFFSLEITIPK